MVTNSRLDNGSPGEEQLSIRMFELPYVFDRFWSMGSRESHCGFNVLGPGANQQDGKATDFDMYICDHYFSS